MLREVIYDFIKLRCDSGCAPTYNYHFNPIFRINDGCTALHSSDIVFVFDNIEMVPSTYLGDGVAESLQEQMANRLLSFAKNGDPQLENDIEWIPCTSNSMQTMRFAEKCEVRENYDKELLEAMKDLKTI